MDKSWISIIKATGPVGVVGLILYFVLQNMYSDKVIDLFGSEKLFTITLVIVSVLAIALFASILLHKTQPLTPEVKKEQEKDQKGPTVNYNGDSTHNGDNNF